MLDPIQYLPTGLRRLAALGVFALAALTLGPAAWANQGTTPSWMIVDTANKTVSFDWMAGFNGNNGALNFNGYHDGDATVVIPIGWKVKMTLGNQDAEVPHSMLVTKPYAMDAMPLKAGRPEVAISRAYTNNPERGLSAGETDSFHFTAKAPGKYYLFCGVPGHGQAGMWIHLTLSAEATEPKVIVAKGVDGRP